MIEKSEKNKKREISNGGQNSVGETKKKQIRNLIIVFSVLLCLLGFLYFVISDNDSNKKDNKKIDAEFASAMKHVDAGSILIERTESRLSSAEKTTEVLQEKIAELNRENERKDKNVPKEQEKISILINRINELEEKLNQSRIDSKKSVSGDAFPGVPGRQGETDRQNQRVLMTQGIRNDEITLVDPSEFQADIPQKNPKDYVPSGTFVKAVALGGADASAAVNAQSNPQPMLFRIIEDGTMPNNKKSHLKGCLATAAVVGDISSERGFIRLETLSCIEPDTNKVIDLNVEGTIFGPEGKSGIRGVPMWREGKLLQRAFAAGALSGLSNAITQKYTQTSVSPLGTIKSLSNDSKDILQYGAAGGIGTAMEKLADYNIRRAEQYHPVLQLSAGTIVDIVFLKGFYFDDSKTKKTATTQGRLASATYTHNLNNSRGRSGNLANKTNLPFTSNQIKKLKEKGKEFGRL